MVLRVVQGVLEQASDIAAHLADREPAIPTVEPGVLGELCQSKSAAVDNSSPTSPGSALP